MLSGFVVGAAIVLVLGGTAPERIILLTFIRRAALETTRRAGRSWTMAGSG